MVSITILFAVQYDGIPDGIPLCLFSRISLMGCFKQSPANLFKKVTMDGLFKYF